MLIVPVLVMLCFARSLIVAEAIKWAYINNQPCMVRPMLIDFNPDELYYSPFIISMSSYNGIYNTAKDPLKYPSKYVFPKNWKM